MTPLLKLLVSPGHVATTENVWKPSIITPATVMRATTGPSANLVSPHPDLFLPICSYRGSYSMWKLTGTKWY